MRVFVSSFLLLVLSSVVFAQIPGFDTRYSFFPEGTEYGMQQGEGLAGVQIVLAEAGRAGSVVAEARTGAGGGVTFNNVRPGTYVILISVPNTEAKSAFESRSHVVRVTPRWRSFDKSSLFYAVRAPNHVIRAEELRSSGAGTVITQEFEIRGSAPITVVAAIGRSTNC